jgi:outer membrane protein assembly factor BamB
LTGVLEASSHAVTKLSGFRGHPVIDGDNVIVGNDASRTVSIHIPSGERTWQKEFGAAQTPWVAGNTIFILTTQNELIALLEDTGQIRWVTTLARFKKPDKKDDPIFWTGPVLAGGRLILASSSGKLIEVDPQTGKIQKQTDISNTIMLPPIVAQSTLLILSDNGTLSAYK